MKLLKINHYVKGEKSVVTVVILFFPVVLLVSVNGDSYIIHFLSVFGKI